MFRLNVDKEINLVFLQKSLAGELYTLVDNNREHLGKWLTWVRDTTSIQHIESFIERSIVGFSREETLVCAIEYKGEIGGIISYNKISKDLRKVDIGYWISSHLQGMGIVSRACQRLVDYAFDELELDKVEIKVATGNLRSRNVCEKLGFSLEGVISNAENLNGHLVSHAVYALHANRQ